jgi:hypothetical protein
MEPAGAARRAAVRVGVVVAAVARPAAAAAHTTSRLSDRHNISVPFMLYLGYG